MNHEDDNDLGVPGREDGPPAAVSQRILGIFSVNHRIRGLFMGVGLPEFDGKGIAIDRASTGYDRALLKALVAKDVTDPAELERVLDARPDGLARRRGREYRQTVVKQTLTAASGATKPPAPQADFKVEKVLRFDQKPTKYEVTVDGVAFTVGSRDLTNASLFRSRLIDELRRIPVMPAKDDWTAFASAMLAMAENVVQPPEASQELAIREAVARAIDSLHPGDDAVGLDGGMGFLLPNGPYAGHKAFKAFAATKLVKEDFGTVSQGDVCLHLRELGCVPFQLTAGRRGRVWVAPLEAEDAREGSDGATSS